jgi:hypothetical protein
MFFKEVLKACRVVKAVQIQPPAKLPGDVV